MKVKKTYATIGDVPDECWEEIDQLLRVGNETEAKAAFDATMLKIKDIPDYEALMMAGKLRQHAGLLPPGKLSGVRNQQSRKDEVA